MFCDGPSKFVLVMFYRHRVFEDYRPPSTKNLSNAAGVKRTVTPRELGSHRSCPTRLVMCTRSVRGSTVRTFLTLMPQSR